ncbi:MAG: hypothetical protein HY785_15865 [Oscillatoriophycideae cyanobacterium NC_groundwater_1537_Pr4_S-0.65um_50_18]|nr:hypothetical protein [Oscillatoriophycideae cyanobacterium NC_groundwater_1537_Pr4_S-0.65um_50_18]
MPSSALVVCLEAVCEALFNRPEERGSGRNASCFDERGSGRIRPTLAGA